MNSDANTFVPQALIVDDEVIAQKIHTMLLRKLGFQTVTANNGEEAIDLIRQRNFDLLLVDINMPRMNGIELTQLIRKSSEPISKLLIIGVTGHCGDEEINQAKIAGMDKIFTKPLANLLLEKFLSKYFKIN